MLCISLYRKPSIGIRFAFHFLVCFVNQRHVDTTMSMFLLDYMILEAIRFGDTRQVQSLISRSSHINLRNGFRVQPLYYVNRNSNDDAYLHFACREGHVEVARVLIDYKANVNERGLKYNTPLHLACINGDVKLACMLIDHGADINIINVCCLDFVTD
jgi:ankyrin repeat protein